MHFWIDKRSQQCGFGRSRVAASLSGAGGAGMGLSFGHPPRRSSGNKSVSRNALPDCHHSNAAGSSSSSNSRNHQLHHQYQHQQHSQQQQHLHQQQQQQQTCNNNNFNAGHNYQQTPAHNSITSTYTSNNSNIAANPGTTQPSATAALTLNNNSQHYTYKQQQQQQQQPPYHQQSTGNTNVMNNNANTSSTSTTAMTAAAADGRIIVPTATAHNFNQRCAALLQQSSGVGGTSNTPLYQQQHGNQCYDMRSYHHPQFGNMSVRHYQHAGRSCNAAAHANANSAPQQSYRNSGVGGGGVARAIGSVTTAPPTLQHSMEQMSYRQQQQHGHSSSTSAQSSESVMGALAPICTSTTNTTSYAVANTAHRYSSAAINMRTSNITVDSAGGGGGGDAQLLPSHLKCGMCASLVLASVFVAGAKFYLDHQGTGLEVLIFCAFSATFFLAACTVSLCRVPKGLLPSGRNAVLGAATAQHQHHHAGGDGGGGGMHCTRAPYGRRDIGSGHGDGGELTGSDDIHGAPLCGQLQLIEDAANAGPPPYHIAIYFPETESSSKCKDAAEIEDESPPPSYDKILI